MNKMHKVDLAQTERKRLLAIVSTGRNKATVIRRAHILLKCDEGKTDAEIAELLYISTDTVQRLRQRYCEQGLEASLAGEPHPEREPKLDEGQEAYLTAVACSEPPPGRVRWTLALLAEKLVEDRQVSTISPETVRQLLKKNKSSPGG
jgi:transposase